MRRRPRRWFFTGSMAEVAQFDRDGYVVVPDAVEFWQGRPGRLHDRIRYRLGDGDAGWVIERLSP